MKVCPRPSNSASTKTHGCFCVLLSLFFLVIFLHSCCFLTLSGGTPVSGDQKREILMTFWTSFWGSGKDASTHPPTSPTKTDCLGFLFKSVMIQCPDATQKSGMSSAPPRQRARPIPNFHPQRPQGREFSQVVFLATNDNTLPENEQLKHLKRWRIPKGKDHRLPLPAIFRCGNVSFRAGMQKEALWECPLLRHLGFLDPNWSLPNWSRVSNEIGDLCWKHPHGFVEGGEQKHQHSPNGGESFVVGK